MQITQSIVKMIEQECPRKVQDNIANRPPTPPGSPMDKGSFFETLCLGSGAQGMVTTNLPALKSGEKSIDQVRIEMQAQRFKDMFDPKHKDFTGKIIIERQLKLSYGRREGTIDFVTDPLIVYDLKLTENLDGYWADTSSVDFLQQVFYQWLYEMKYGVKPEMRLLIFEYSKPLRIKELRINVSEDATFSALERFNQTEEMVDEWNQLDEWPRVPSLDSCSKCPLFCEKRMIKESIIFQDVWL